MNLMFQDLNYYLKRCFVFIGFIFVNTNNIYAQLNNVEINGLVKDSKTNEIISGAIILAGVSGVALTDSSGYYSFLLKPGKYKIECKYLGYENSIKKIILNKTDSKINLFFYLVSKPIVINKVTVTGNRYKELEQFKTYELQAGDLKNIPVCLESDALRAVQALPGVTALHDLSSLIYLRGGNFDETLISLDNVPVYNSYHLGGIFGSFNPDIVYKEILYPSNYPVNFHGVLSGILDIKTKNGNNEKLKGTGSVSLVSSRLFLEGPLAKGNFVFSARRTYPDLLLNLLFKNTFPYYFYDFFGKYLILLDDKNLFSISGFYSKDIYRLFVDENALVIDKQKDLNWGNKIAKISYNHFFSDAILKLDLSYSNSFFVADAKGFSFRNTYYYSQGDSLDALEHIYINNNISDFSFKSEFDINFTGQELCLGLEYRDLSTSYKWDLKEREISNLINGNFEGIFFDFAPNIYSAKDNSPVISAYSSDKIQLSPSFNLTPGFRAIYIKKTDRVFNSAYILINYNFNENIKLTAGYGRYYEYFFTRKELTNQTYYSPFAMYFISDNQSPMPTSDHFSLGLKIRDLLPSIKLEAEGYFKKRDNIYTSDELTQSSSFANGYAAGIDVLLKKETGNITGWLSYSYSRSVMFGTDYKYFANFDRTHNVKVLLNYNLSETWDINAFWFYSTGLPLTPAVGKYISGSYYGSFGRTFEIAYGRKNSLRYENYNRLDIGIVGNFMWSKIIVKPFLQIMNVYMSKNPFNYKPTPNDSSIEEGSERGSFIVPTIGLTIEF